MARMQAGENPLGEPVLIFDPGPVLINPKAKDGRGTKRVPSPQH